MKTYNLVDKNSSIVITVSGESEEEVIEKLKERLEYMLHNGLEGLEIEEVEEYE